MRPTCKYCKSLGLGLAAALLAPAVAVADRVGGAPAGHGALDDAVSADRLLGGDVHTVANPVGSVRDLILNERGSAVAYVLYEVPYPYALSGADDGFVRFDNVAVEDGATLDTVLRIDDGAARGPRELTLKRSEADHRMVSRLLDDAVAFADGRHIREVEDILVDRHSGELLGFVVNRNPDAWFNDDPRLIPPHKVTIGPDGNVTTDAEFEMLASID
ncbi:MAG: hypothetical protein CMD39_10185 [Gammaproteobacteria bacterium]|nr:hypothetical protein [Gammaproteobacteria bacterium]